jgi:capsular exopolysaccharide synthesis family protein
LVVAFESEFAAMSGIERALKRRRETGSLPDDMSGVADWLSPRDDEPGAAAGLLDVFSNEGAPRGFEHEAPPFGDEAPRSVRRDERPATHAAPQARVDERIRFDEGRGTPRIIEPATARQIPAPVRLPEPPKKREEPVPVARRGRETDETTGRAATEGRIEPPAERSRPALEPPTIPERPDEISSRAPDEAPNVQGQPAPESRPLFSGFNRSTAGKIVSGPGMDAATAEQYRRLAVALHHVQGERGVKKVMVTSAMAGEGKTLTALNLALTLSESYLRRVVFIDADLRCSRVHELLNVVNVEGLNEVLREGSRMRPRLVEISPRLSVLLAGRPTSDPMGALTSTRMADILDEAAATFDWVVVDSPPVVLLPDANVLAKMVDTAVVVVHAGKTAYDMVERAVQTIDRKRVLGVVLNDVQDGEALQYYYSPKYAARSTPQ